jgi:hypothetical protein
MRRGNVPQGVRHGPIVHMRCACFVHALCIVRIAGFGAVSGRRPPPGKTTFTQPKLACGLTQADREVRIA